MSIRIAVQGTSSTYSKRWLEYCRENQINHEIVDCYGSDIIEHLKGYDALLWNFTHHSGTDLMMARHVLTAAEHMGLVVFPDKKTCWHFDDKLAQKYLLEAIEAPIVPTYAFYDLTTALDWLRSAEYPLVRKLRRGAGSYNVGLVHGYRQAARFCERAFGRGFPALPGHFADAATRVRNVPDLATFWRKVKGRPRAMLEYHRRRASLAREKGYVLFQEFIPDNEYDIRITVVGNRAWGFARGVRKNDFRASGSGDVRYDLAYVDPKCVEISFEVARRLGSQSTCFDFVRGADRRPWITEISYGFVPEAVHACEGYWDGEMQWHDGHCWPEHAMIEDVIAEVRRRKRPGGSPLGGTED